MLKGGVNLFDSDKSDRPESRAGPDIWPTDSEEESQKGVGSTRYRILNICYLVVLTLEGILCYRWLIYPIIPIITGLIQNKGVPSVRYTGGAQDPLGGIMIFGMDAGSFFTLLLQTFFRIIFFVFVFWGTPKVFRLIRKTLGSTPRD